MKNDITLFIISLSMLIMGYITFYDKPPKLSPGYVTMDGAVMCFKISKFLSDLEYIEADDIESASFICQRAVYDYEHQIKR